MLRIIDELYKISDNSRLFEHLRTGGDLAAIASRLAASSGESPKTTKTELLRAFSDAIVPVLQSDDHSSLQKLIDQSDLNARVTIGGELILTLYALKEGKHINKKVDAILDRAFRLVRALASTFEAGPPQDADDEELLAHAIALREWAYLFAGYYQTAGIGGHHAEMLMVRARVTNCTLSSWPHLVGAAMVDLSLVLEPFGKVDLAIQCCNGVRMDLRYLADRIDDPSFPEFEKVTALYWLQRACEVVSRLVPADATAPLELEKVRALRQERNHPDAISAPRFGPIAKTYLAPTPYLALIIRDLQTNSGAEATVCQRYGCLSRDVTFYLSAMGSYVIRDTILRGVHMIYDDAHLQVFAAIDFLRQQENNKQ